MNMNKVWHLLDGEDQPFRFKKLEHFDTKWAWKMSGLKCDNVPFNGTIA